MAQNEKKKLQVIKLNYDTKQGGNWTACILAFSSKEAINFTRRLLGNNFHSSREISSVSQVDAITTEVQEFLKKDTKQEQTPVLQCPWCDKTFDSKHGLKVHLSKSSCKKPAEKTEEKTEE